jgi:hypothetical protein
MTALWRISIKTKLWRDKNIQLIASLKETNEEYSERDGGMAQVLACLPSKHEAMSSNSSTAKQQTNKITQR